MSTTAIRHRPCPNAERTASLFNRIKATFSDGRNAREFRSDRFPHSRLVIVDSESGLTVTLSQPFLPYSDGRTEQMILPLSALPSGVSRFFYLAADPGNATCDCSNGIFRADALFKASALSFSKISVHQSPSDPPAAYERTVILYESRACQAARRALILLDEFLAAENLGFTTANLGFRY